MEAIRVIYYKGKQKPMSKHRTEIQSRLLVHFKDSTVCPAVYDALKMATSSLLLLSRIGRVYFLSPHIWPLTYFDQRNAM